MTLFASNIDPGAMDYHIVVSDCMDGWSRRVFGRDEACIAPGSRAYSTQSHDRAIGTRALNNSAELWEQ